MTKLRKITGLLFSLGLLGASLLAWDQKQAIYDWYKLQGYNPPSAVEKLARDTTMAKSARRVFYVYHPAIENNTNFSQHCPQSEQTIVLGCYIKNRGIYLYNVTDKRLNGVKEVTAAHELLHAAYDRLSDKERLQVSTWLKQSYSQLKDQRIKKNINAYRKAGADVINELHSILGTEVRDLPNDLENYYKKYFNNRSKIVVYSEQYEGHFTDLKERASKLEAQIKQLKDKIDDLSSELDTERQQLEVSRSTITTNSQADAFNARVRSYNNSLSYLNQLISRHNTLVKEHQQLIVEQNQLFKAIDARSSSFD